MLAISLQMRAPLALTAQVKSSHNCTAILGLSGAGKTSFLRAIAGLEKHTGSIVINGKEIQQLPTHQRPIAMVQQTPMLIPHWNLQQHIKQVRHYSLSKQLNPERLLKQLDLSAFINSYPTQLSGGQQQRVALLLALLREPQLLILDEAFSGIDESSKQKLFPVLRKTLHTLNAQSLLVSHQLRDCAALAEQAWVLEKNTSGVSEINWQGDIKQGLRYYQGNDNHFCVLDSQFSHFDELAQLNCYNVGGQKIYGFSNALHQHETQTSSNDKPHTRLAIYADDIGLSLTPLENSSFVNCIKVEVSQLLAAQSGWLVECLLGGQHVQAHISQKSLNSLKITVGQTIYFIAKAGAIHRL